MKDLLTVIAALLMLVQGISVQAQGLKFSGQVRYRGEFEKNRENFNTVLFGNEIAGDEFAFLRSRLGISYEGPDNVSVFLQFQDSRRFGEELNTLTDADADMIDLHQGYIRVGDFIFDDLSLKVGRMEIALGNERLVGAVGWSNTARSFDGGLIERQSDTFSVLLFGVRVREKEPFLNFDPDEDFLGYFGTYKYAGNKSLNSFAFLNLNSDRLLTGPDNDKNKLIRLTFGLNYVDVRSRFDQEYEAVYQFGKQSAGQSAPRNDIGAYMLAARLKYKFDAARNPFLGVGFDWLSGDDDTNDSDAATFNTLFATNHKFYGFMDYFLNIPVSTSNLGLVDVIVSGGLDIHDKVNVQGAWHYFVTPVANQKGNSFLGNELDLTLRYAYRQNLGVQAGFSLFFPGDIPKQSQDNDNLGIWFYTQMTYNFNN